MVGDAVLYAELAKTAQDRDFECVDTVLVGEDNYQSFSDNISLGVTWYKRRRLNYKDL